MVEKMQPIVPSTRPRVSVVIPNFNYGRYLGDAAASALSQNDVEVDVIIIDNASTDNSRDVAETLAEADSRVRCIFRTSNQGMVANANEGMSYADGEYVVLLAADDLLTPGSLRRSTALLDSRPDVAFAYGNAWHFSGKPPVARTDVRSWSIWTGPEWVSQICRNGRSVILNPEVVMRRSVMSNLRYDATNELGADFKLWLDATRYGAVGHIDGPDQAFFRVHGANLSMTTNAGLLLGFRSRARVFDDFFAEEQKALSTASGDRMHEIWRRTLAIDALDHASRSYDRGCVVPLEVRELEEFAIAIYSGARELPEWRGLSRRKKVGERFAQYVPIFFAAAIRRRLNEEIARWRWARTGIGYAIPKRSLVRPAEVGGQTMNGVSSGPGGRG